MTRFEIYQKGPSHQDGFVIFNLDSKSKELEGGHEQVINFAQKHQGDSFFVNSPLARSLLPSRSILSDDKEPSPLKYSKSQSTFVRLFHNLGFGNE